MECSIGSWGDIGDSRAVEPLIEALGDEEDRGIRWRAAVALGEIGDERAVEPLIETLKDEDIIVRWNAAEALGEIEWQPKDDVERAYYLIAREQWNKLVKLGEPTVEPLIKTLGDKDWDVRMRAARALGEIGDERAVEPLIELLEDDDEGVRESAEEALEKIKEQKS